MSIAGAAPYIAACQILCSAIDWKYRDPATIERNYRRLKNYPPHRLISRPVYKMVVSRTNPVFATAVSFFVTDLLAHQFLVQMAFCAVKIGPCSIQWYPVLSLGWMTFAIPVMRAKANG